MAAQKPLYVRGKKRLNGGEPVAVKTTKRAKKEVRIHRTSYATLEGLPDELIYIIFEMSMNPNLRLVSRRFSGLKTEYGKMAYHLLAPTWDHYQNSPVGDLLPAVARRPELAAAQTELLNQPWCSFDVILDAHKRWVQRAHKSFLPFAHQTCEGTFETCIYHCNPPSDEPHIFDPVACFEHDFARALTMADSREIYDLKDIRNHQVVEPTVRIPLRLLLATNDEQKTKLLYWLLSGGAYNPYALMATEPLWDTTEHLQILHAHADYPTRLFVVNNQYICAPGCLPLGEDGYDFYRRLKQNPFEYGTPEWDALNSLRLMCSIDHFKREDLRAMRRKRGFNPNDSEEEYDEAYDSDVASDDLSFGDGVRRYKRRRDGESLQRWMEMHGCIDEDKDE